MQGNGTMRLSVRQTLCVHSSTPKRIQSIVTIRTPICRFVMCCCHCCCSSLSPSLYLFLYFVSVFFHQLTFLLTFVLLLPPPRFRSHHPNENPTGRKVVNQSTMSFSDQPTRESRSVLSWQHHCMAILVSTWVLRTTERKQRTTVKAES